ncbi:hypothetical protein [Micromonospora sp. NPDC047730]|uniref:hypothetical protein n=1 Tax=Micromonospora sp. NPDC047730 TaxID=3364253 RepID=UPI00371AB2B0
MTNPLDELAAEVAEAHSLDPAAFAARVRRQLARRMERGARPFKRCAACDRDLPARDFAEDRSRPDGLQRRCRQCDRDRSAARRSASPTPGTLT